MALSVTAGRRVVKPIPSAHAAAEGIFVAGDGVIYGPDGNEFVPVGANLGTTLCFDWAGTANGHAAAAVSWGWNCIRLNVMGTDFLGTNYLAMFPGLAAFLTYLDGVITQYTSLGIVVILEAHDNPKYAGKVQSVIEADMVTFWAAAAAKWKNNAYVWFNPINEPAYSNAEWVALHRRLCWAVRWSGASAPLVVDAPVSGQDGGSAYNVSYLYGYDPAMAPALEAEFGNVILASHPYGWFYDTPAELTAYVGNVRAAGLTPLFGEFGYTYNGTSTAGTYTQNYDAAQAVFSVAPALGVGALWWHGTHADYYTLTANNTGFWNADPTVPTNTSDGGMNLWALTH